MKDINEDKVLKILTNSFVCVGENMNICTKTDKDLIMLAKDICKLMIGINKDNVRRIIDTGTYIGGNGFTQTDRNVLKIEIHSFGNYIGNCLKIGDKVDLVHYYKK